MKVQCSALTVRFGNNIVLDGIDLTIDEREQLALLGPSGAGKSTLLRVLLGAVRPAAGTVRIGSRDPFASPRELNAVRRCAGVIRQRDDLVRGLTARTNILIGLSHRWRAADWLTVARGRTPARWAARLAQLAAEHGVDEFLDAKIENLSGGQRQRVALVRALLPEPELLLADEATSGLDMARARAALADLRSAGATLIVTTHDVAIARQFDRIVALKEGQVVFDGSELSTSDVREIYGTSELVAVIA
ncbi:MAG TPA: ATP-binding cassette domain-containing protein [Candidatus Limnocylindrales bacterium]|nr:ATP-binding cassette domain-containing protein [Candidatus Limnocylindrales bacterium]